MRVVLHGAGQEQSGRNRVAPANATAGVQRLIPKVLQQRIPQAQTGLGPEFRGAAVIGFGQARDGFGCLCGRTLARSASGPYQLGADAVQFCPRATGIAAGGHGDEQHTVGRGGGRQDAQAGFLRIGHGSGRDRLARCKRSQEIAEAVREQRIGGERLLNPAKCAVAAGGRWRQGGDLGIAHRQEGVMEVFARELLGEPREGWIGPPIQGESDRRQTIPRPGAFVPVDHAPAHDQHVGCGRNETLQVQPHAGGPGAGDPQFRFLDEQALGDGHAHLVGRKVQRQFADGFGARIRPLVVAGRGALAELFHARCVGGAPRGFHRSSAVGWAFPALFFDAVSDLADMSRLRVRA